MPTLVGAYVVFQATQKNGYQSGFSLSLMLAFSLCSIGDIFFALESVGLNEFYFASYIFFTLAHFSFIYALVYGVPVSTIKAKRHWGQLAVATLILVYVAEVFVLNRHYFGNALFEISIYGSFLSIMTIATAMRLLHHGLTSYFTLLIGSVCFLTSDVLIVVTSFSNQLSWFEPVIIPLYHLAIILMVYGFSVGKANSYSVNVKSVH